MQTFTMCTVQKWVTGGYRVQRTLDFRPEVCSEHLNLVKFFHLVVPKVFLKGNGYTLCVLSAQETYICLRS